MAELPSGTVTFLFTDIERSTQTVGELGDAPYAELQDHHRALLRKAFAAHDGVEVGTEGDAFFVAFARAGDAVAAAIDGQRALAEGSQLRVRMGIHTGEALVRDNSYVGHDVHKAKRVEDAGHGGQILLSQTTADLVRSSVDLKDLGPHGLKDLAEPQRLYQVLADGLITEFPPLRSLNSFHHNLPVQRSTFIGREREIQETIELLQSSRLVTLTGIGGCGKTRLAQQVGAEMLDRYADGVFFVDLAQIADPDIVPSTIALAVGAPIQTDANSALRGTADTMLIDFLSHRACLLILDNCEHLLDACAELVDRILSSSGDVVILATSREALDVEGEESRRVPSLSLGTDGDVQSSEAVSLFKARARTARPNFDLTPENVEAVVEICRRLDGIPLAIEFAAARVSHLAPAEIAERLGDMLTLLAGGHRRRVQRQQTLQAALDWSYELLSPAEKKLLQRVAIFPGGFGLDAAEGICSGEGIDRGSVLDLLGSLVAKSLVTTDETAAKTRYRLIETVRLYAMEKLRENDDVDLRRTRHRDWYQAWIRSFDWDSILFYADEEGTGDMAQIAVEQASLRSALEWSETQGRPELAVSMASRMGRVWSSLGSFEEGLRWLTLAERPEDLDLPTEEKVAALAFASFLTNIVQGPGSAELAERAVALSADQIGGPFAQAHYQRAVGLGIRSQWTADPELADAARAEMDEAIRCSAGLPLAQHYTDEGRTWIELLLGDIPAAARRYAASRSGDVGLAGPMSAVLRFSNMAAAHHLLGEHDRAEVAARRYLEGVDRFPERATWYGGAVGSAAVAIAGAGNIIEASDILRKHLVAVRRSGRPGALEEMMVSVAAIAHLTGNDGAASRLLGWARSRTFDAGRILPSPSGYAIYQHYVRLVRSALDPEAARVSLREGRSMSEEQALACADQVIAERGD